MLVILPPALRSCVANGPETLVSDPLNHTTRSPRDPHGQIVQVDAPTGLSTQYQYDGLDRLAPDNTPGRTNTPNTTPITRTPTRTRPATSTFTLTPTPANSLTPTVTRTVVRTATPSRTPTRSLTPTASKTATPFTNTPTPTATPNVARGKVASQSSIYSGMAASRAVDGNTNGAPASNSVAITNSEARPWWQVDLGDSYYLDALEIWTRTNCCMEQLSNYYVFVSDTAFLGNGIEDALHTPGVSAYFFTEPAGRPTLVDVNRWGRYVRVQLTGTANLALAEVVVYEGIPGSSYMPTATPYNLPSPTATTNPATGKAASQSSTASGGVASRAVDGNTDGHFAYNSVSHTNSQLEAWWQVDLGSSFSLAEVEIWNRTDCCMDRLSNFYLFVSDEPFTTTTVAGSLAQVGVGAYYQAGAAGELTRVAVNRTGRYLRVQLTGTNALHLAEIRVIEQIPISPTPTASLTLEA